MSLPQKPALKAGAGPGLPAAAVVPPQHQPGPLPSVALTGLRTLSGGQIPRGPVQQGLDDRIFTPPTVSAVYSTVAAQVARQPGTPVPSPYSAHEISKAHTTLSGTPPGHASSPGLPQAPYGSGQNAATLVYPQAPPTMNTQQQNRSPFAPGPRPTHHQDLNAFYKTAGIPSQPLKVQAPLNYVKFFQRPQLQPPRTAIQNSSPTIRPGAQAPTAVYQTNQHIMMVNHLPMPYAMPQGHQYCIPQYPHSAPQYVGPPQQYPVQPPGPSPFYPGPGEFASAYGSPFYPNQPVYQSAPIIVPTQQQPQPPPQPAAPTKREKKTIRIRDPNRGGKDITEEIMSGSGGSRNSTPPIGRPSSTPTPPEVPEPNPVKFGTVEHIHIAAGSHLSPSSDQKPEEKPKLDPVLHPSPAFQPECSSENKDPTDQTSEAPLLDTTLELPSHPLTPHVEPPSIAAASVLLAPVALFCTPPSSGDSMDICELTAVTRETMPLPASARCEETPEPLKRESLHEDISKEACVVMVPADIPVTVSSTTIISELNGISSDVAAIDNMLNIAPEEKTPVAVQLEEPELISVVEEKVDCVPHLVTQPATFPSPAHVPSHVAAVTAASGITLSPPFATTLTIQRDFEREHDARTSNGHDEETIIEDGGYLQPAFFSQTTTVLPNLNSRRISVQEPPSPKMWKKPKEHSQSPEKELEPKGQVKLSSNNVMDSDLAMSHSFYMKKESIDLKLVNPVEENGVHKLETVRNGTDIFSEGEGADLYCATMKFDEAVPAKQTSGEIPNNLPQCASPELQKTTTSQEKLKPHHHNEKKQYDRDFLLGFQFMPACVQKPVGLPPISDVVLDKINQTKLPSRTVEPRILQRGPDFTPPFADFGRPVPAGRGVPQVSVGTRRSQPNQRREPRKIIMNLSVTEDVRLKKAENAWKPGMKRENQPEDPENIKTQELFRKVRSILNKLTPQMFNQLMKQVTDLTVDTEERLKGVIDLVFEKAIDEPSFSVAYANMCRCLATLKVQMTDKPASTVNFRKLLLNRCQKEFEKDKADDDVFERKQKELESAKTPEEKTRLQEELEESKDKARRRSIGNIKFIGELFKLKMLTEAIMHDCMVKLLKNHDEESLECLCRLLTTIGKDLDFEKAKPRMDQYFNQMDKIVKERKTSSRIRFMLQDIIDLRRCNWVSRRADQGPKTIEQIHKEAKIEEQEEQRKVQQLITKEKRRPGVQRSDDSGWNTVQMPKNNRSLDPIKLLKITKPTIDDKIQLVPKAQLGSWGKGSSGGAKVGEPESLRPGATSLNRFSALQQPGSSVSPAPTTSEFDSQRTLIRGSTGREKSEKPSPLSPARSSPFNRGSSSKDLLDNQLQEEQRRETLETVKQLTGNVELEKQMVDEERAKTRLSVKPEIMPVSEHEKLALHEQEMEKKSKAIIDEFLHINDFKEAIQCVEELSMQCPLSVFVRVGVESTLERSQIARDHMGQLLHQLVHAEKLNKEDLFKGFSETLELADDMAIDIPHIWLYLAELVTPMLKEGGISMRELITEFSKPLLPVGRGGVLLSEILHLLCKQMSHKKVRALWREAGLNWKDFIPEGEDEQKFISEKKLDFTVLDCCSSYDALSKKEFSAEELDKRLARLVIEEKANDEQIFDWVEANLDEFQMSSPTFLRALMTAVCKAAIIGDSSSFRVDTAIIKQRVPVLLKYLDSDTERELEALYALQALIAKLDQPANLLRMFFDCLYDEEVISEDAFYRWEASKDPSEQNGKGVALKSVTAFFTWLREAEEESEDS
ncbi:eukaryotic translation initiation factor 4 gamma 3 isoform X4 [Ambystoma mexicanum]|uniref:eukaryotic translation initiation factor 4 gamma 3 isoform X4 n=1 Tax=Ambystoma mexicanum TaxID=8296 RepID=UPI0037E731ED